MLPGGKPGITVNGDQYFSSAKECLVKTFSSGIDNGCNRGDLAPASIIEIQHTLDGVCLIAEDDGEPVGFAYLEYETQNYADLLESVVWLHDIYLAADARGQGTGRKLIEACAKAAEQLGADKLVLHVAARNAVGQDFFERDDARSWGFGQNEVLASGL